MQGIARYALHPGTPDGSTALISSSAARLGSDETTQIATRSVQDIEIANALYFRFILIR